MPERPVAPHDHSRFSRGGRLSIDAISNFGTTTSGSSGGGGGETDHGALSGLGDDDHPRYNIIIKDEGVTAGTATVLNFTGTGGTASVSGGTATIDISGGGIIVKDEGSTVGTATILDFVGAGVTATFSGGTATATISGGSAAGSIITQDEGSTIGTATVLNFVGAGATAAYSGGTTIVTAPGVIFQDEGSAIGTGIILNVVGSGATAAFSSGTATVTISGGTASAVSWTQADEVPTGPNSHDDEFEDSSGSGWTFQASTSTIQNQSLGEWQEDTAPTDPQWNIDTDIPSALVLSAEVGVNNIKAYKAFAPTSGTRWAILAKVRVVIMQFGTNNSPGCRLWVENTTPTAANYVPTDGVVIDLTWVSNVWQGRSYSINNGGAAANVTTGASQSTMYLGFAGQTDNGITTYISEDGLAFRRLFKYTGLDINGAVSHVVIASGAVNASNHSITICEWIRFLEGSGNLWDLGSGN